MRCDTARRRFPEPRAARHVGGCAACGAWFGRVGRARVSAAAGFAPLPSGLARRVLAATRELPAPARRRAVPRLSAVAVAVALIAGGAAVWVVASGRGTAQAVAAAAERTGDAASARFTFEGDFSVRLRVPEDVVDRLVERFPGGSGGLNRALIPPGIPSEIRKGVERHLEIGRRWLIGRVGEGLRALEPFSPQVRVEVSGEGEFASRDRVRMEGSVSVSEPDSLRGDLELVRIGDRLFVRIDGVGVQAGAGGPSTGVFRPVAFGLGRLSRWIGEDARRAESLGRETLGRVETERYRLDLPARGDGVVNRVDVWVGTGDGLVHRVLITHRVDRRFAEISGRVDVRLFDHGAKVDIRPPRGVEADDRLGLSAGPGVRLGVRLGEIDVWIGAGLPGPRPAVTGSPRP